MQTLLGTNTKSDGEPYIEVDSSGTNYFAKGHLSPDAAFVYDAEQDATYYFMNVAPQFQSFNNGNWKSLEMATRKYAEEEAKGDVKVCCIYLRQGMFPSVREGGGGMRGGGKREVGRDEGGGTREEGGRYHLCPASPSCDQLITCVTSWCQM